MKIPEILAPAGDITSLKAAFAAGADAVYFGLPGFNARQRAENIKPEMLPAIAAEAFLRRIKLYLTLNTLVTEDEIPRAVELAESAAAAGIKAFIIQDMGILHMLKQKIPYAEIHLSTQAATHTSGQIEFLSRCGISRVNLSRELDISEIRTLTKQAHRLGMETEVFVHGSYCISWSGQCYLCSFLEGCSGNRGLCQQNCRRVYRKGGEPGYFLNLKDNSAVKHAGDLIDAGVDSLKIEGRIKSSLYVYSTVKGWKKLLSDPENPAACNEADALFDGVFNRGFTDSYMADTVSREMFAPSPLDSSLKESCRVMSYTADTFTLYTDLQISLDNRTEIIIKESSGSFICAADAEKSRYLPDKSCYASTITIKGKLDGKIGRSCIVYTPCPALSAGEAEKSINSISFRKIPLTANISARAGQPLQLKLEAAGMGQALHKSEMLLEKSRNAAGSDRESFIRQLSRFGSTLFELEETVFDDWEDRLFIPASEVNNARKLCVSALLRGPNTGRVPAPLVQAGVIQPAKNRGKPGQAAAKGAAKLSVYLDSLSTAQNLYALYGSCIEIMFDITDPDINLPEEYVPVFPSVMTLEAEEKYSSFIKNCRNRKIILNSTALVKACEDSGKNWIAGPFLNITNSCALKELNNSASVSGAIASLELSSGQVKSFMDNTELPVYMFIYSSLLLMTTRQCLLGYRCGEKTSRKECFYLSCGSDNLDEIRGRRLKIRKRGWRFTELYDENCLSVPEAVMQFRESAHSFIIDLRDFNQASRLYAEVTAAFIELVENPEKTGCSRINTLLKSTSKGNFKKGLS